MARKQTKLTPRMSPQNDGHHDGHAASLPPCPSCGVKDQQVRLMESSQGMLNEQIVFLRRQVEKLQDQMLSFVPNAADQYTRMVLSRQAQMSAEAQGGMMSIKDLAPDAGEMSDIDQLQDDIMMRFGSGN